MTILKTRTISRNALLMAAAVWAGMAQAQISPGPEDYFSIVDVPVPEGVLLEVGGLAAMPDGDLGIGTRRGEVFVVKNPTSEKPEFQRFAYGLHEILGLTFHEDGLLATQRGELTRLIDYEPDGQADAFETVQTWPLSGNYHEYSFGPAVAPDGAFFVSGNVGFTSSEWWRGVSLVPWRGWVMRIADGKMEPWATGMRSPAGLGFYDGELFYSDNQGDWVGSNGIWHLTKGAFAGHPAGLVWADREGSPVEMTQEDLFGRIDERRIQRANGSYVRPRNVDDETDFKTMAEMVPELPHLRLPAVWLPYAVLGVSTSQPIQIPEGVFGPFAGQMLVGDQGQSKVMRVFLEKVNGEYQGAAFDFRSGFKSGVLRLLFAEDGSLFVGMTNRGWGSAGTASEGLQRLVYNGETPFEMKAVRAMPDGFEIEFTEPVDRASAEDVASYWIQGHTYKYHSVYGSPPVRVQEHPVRGVRVSEDGLKARIVVDGLRRYYLHQITLEGVRSREGGHSLVHPTAYYTLNNIPAGRKLNVAEMGTRDSRTELAEKGMDSGLAGRATGLADVRPLLSKNTCTACHSTGQRQVGPAFIEIAKKNYSDDRIVELIRQPEPENWPDFETPMPPMPHVSESDARQIATWINGLGKEE